MYYLRFKKSIILISSSYCNQKSKKYIIIIFIYRHCNFYVRIWTKLDIKYYSCVLETFKVNDYILYTQ